MYTHVCMYVSHVSLFVHIWGLLYERLSWNVYGKRWEICNFALSAHCGKISGAAWLFVCSIATVSTSSQVHLCASVLNGTVHFPHFPGSPSLSGMQQYQPHTYEY